MRFTGRAAAIRSRRNYRVVEALSA